tara:strand:- start:302 stop:964 length:663 start_codon:yes stop_codon:yes gene_type:complete
MNNILFSLLMIISDTSNADFTDMGSNLIHEDAEDGLRLAFESSVRIISVSGGGTSYGSGNLFTHEGEQYIITANHVIEGTLFLDILEKNGTSGGGYVLVSNSELDLAIVKPYKKLSGTYAVKFEHSKDNRLGKKVFHCGHPLGVPFNLSKGMITGYETGGYIIDSISLPGTSGSVVFDEDGKVIGVVVSIASIGKPPNVQLIEGIVRVVPIDLTYILDMR